LRPVRFVTRKVVAAACRISQGSGERLQLGNLGVRRDWGWAPEYVDAMWRMLQQPQAADFVIATGSSFALEEFVAAVFAALQLNWRDHVDIVPALYRPSDISEGRGNAAQAAAILGWRAQKTMPEVVTAMVEAELALQQR
jgi:GDPmannose 4,6-dehydratase